MATILTDDELVAIAASADTTWPTVLPTIDTDDDTDVARAIQRGIRSLGLRGLVSTDQAGADEAVDLARDVLKATPPVMAYLARGSRVDRIAGNGFAAAHRGGDDWVTDVIGITGVHNMAAADSETVAAFLSELAGRVFSDGITNGPPDSVLYLVGSRQDERRSAIQVSRGVCQVGAFTRSDSSVLFEPLPGVPVLESSVRRLVETNRATND